MARRPRYQKVGVTLDAPARTDFAGLRETARAAQNISQQIDRMSQFVYKEQERAAEQRGRQMVEDIGAQPTLKKLSAAGGPTNIEQRAAYATANRIAAAEIETQAQMDIDKVIADAEVNELPFSEVQGQLKDIINGYPAALSDLDAETAGVLRQQLMRSAQKAETSYSVFYNKIQIKAAQGRALQGIDVRRRGIYKTAARQYYDEDGNVDEVGRQTMIDMDLQNLAQYMRDLQFDEDDISKILIETKNQTYKESTLFDFRQLGSLEEKRAFIEEQREKLPGIIGEEDARTLMNSLNADLGKITTGLKGQATAAEQEIAEARKVLLGGGKLNDQTFAALEAKVGGLGEYGADAVEDLGKLKRMSAAMEGFRQMPPPQLQDTINAMRSGIAGMGGDGVDTLEEVELLEQAETLLNNMNTEAAKDPYTLGIKLGVISMNPLDLSLFGSSDEAMQMQAREQANTRIGSALQVAAHLGTPPTFLTDEEAKVIINTMETGTVGEQMMMLTGLYNVFGEQHVSDVFAQISKKAPEVGHIAGLIMTGNHQTAADALAGMDILQQGYKPPEFTPTNTDTVYNEQLADAFAFLPDSMIAGKEIAKALYAKRAQRAGLDSFSETLWTQSISDAYGQSMGMGGIQDVYGKKMLMPSDVSAAEIETAFNNMTPDDLYRASGVRLSEELFNFIFKPSEERAKVFGFGIPGTGDDAEFNSDDFRIVATGKDTYTIMMGEPGDLSSRIVEGTYEDEMGGVEGSRRLEINMKKLLKKQ